MPCELSWSVYIMLPISTIFKIPVAAVVCVYMVPSSKKHQGILLGGKWENVSVNVN